MFAMGQANGWRIAATFLLACAALTPLTGWAQTNPLGLPEKSVSNQGTLMICGGGLLPDEIYQEFVRLAGGSGAKIILIPSAKKFESQSHLQNRFSRWNNFEKASFQFLDTDSRDQADSDDFIRPLVEATGVWISGGEQGRLANLYNGTKVEAALRQVLERGGVVAGTSAGAAIMSRVMIHHGSAAKAVVDRGFGLVEQVVVDQHFSQRARHTRLIGVLENHPQLIGLGVDEGTSVLVRGNHLRVLGNSQATIFTSQDEQRGRQVYHLRADDEAQVIVRGPATKDPQQQQQLMAVLQAKREQ